LKEAAVGRTAAAEANADEINEILSRFALKRVGPHFDLPGKSWHPNPRDYRTKAKVTADYAQKRVHANRSERPKDAARIVQRLRKSKSCGRPISRRVRCRPAHLRNQHH